MDGVPVKLEGPVYGPKSQPPDLAYPSAKGQRPRAPGNIVPSRGVGGAARIPVGRQAWPTCQVIALLQVVVDEILQQHLVHIRSMGGTGDREQIANQDTHCPMSRLDQRHYRRPNAELTLTGLRARGSRQNKRRSRPIDELPGMCRGSEERGVHISNSDLAPSGRRWR